MGNDPFLEALRKKAVESNNSLIDAAEAEIAALSAKSQDGLKKILVPIHTLKGDLGALGYVIGQQLLHDLETHINDLEEKRGQNPQTWSSAGEEFFKTIQFCISDGLSPIRQFLASVKDGRDEDPSKLDSLKRGLGLVQTITGEFQKLIGQPANKKEMVAQAMRETLRAVEMLSLESEETTELPPPKPEPKAATPIAEKLPASPKGTATETPTATQIEIQNRKDFYLLCSLSGNEYALPVNHVREVIKHRDVQSLPVDRSDLIGLINLRGETLPVCNVDQILMLSADSHKKTLPLMVICQIGERKLAIPMQRADKVLEIQSEKFRPLDSSTTGKSSQLIRQILPEDERVILLVDVERLVSA